MLGERQHIFYV